ncbi:hypothetical protein MVEG_11495 [Podila verticillata NRRL 6337]|uniref:Threonine/serine exporter-like N-terminal domain-containing protein n=1 Tax=Podila verticillata NRRL 6337 TaxID=1069443 RepID=A0A086TK07_9FUNG|nr:hypothetical protein MVEG_11495 [Podila verticillata NRRL 6337]
MSDKNLLPPPGTPPRQQSTASSSATASTSTSSASLNRLNNINTSNSSPISSSQQQHQLRASPSNSTLPLSTKNAVPSTSRYNPPVPSRMTGTYSSNNSIYKGNFGSNNSRLGASSAPSSPPGTPPNGLRNYYLNAASKRASHIYSSGSASNSTTTLQRPNISIIVPSNSNNNTLAPPAARRSYSTGHLAIDEPEITVTTPGGSHSTEEHVMNLQKALSNLIEKELQGEDTRPRVSMEDEDDDDDDTDGPIVMKGSKTDTKRSSAPGLSTGGNNKGVSLTPKVLSGQSLDPEKATATVTHGISGSDISLGGLELSDKEQRLKEKKRSNRISRLFNRDSPNKLGHEQRYAMDDISRQPSKAGVLSNLLKLQGNVRQPKQHRITPPGPKAQKEKKKRPKLYSRSANNSVTSLTNKSVFGTYPPLPVTPMGSTTGMGTLTTTNNRNNTSGNHRNSFQFEGFAGAFPAGHSPYVSPNGSPRGSFSYDTTTLSPESIMGTLSSEEKMRITFAVADILQRQDYVLRLARAMIKFGAPSHRLEDAVDHTARTLELNLQCVYLPNVMIVAFTDYETHTSETHLLKVSAGLDMYKFAQVHQILKMVTHSSMPVEEAIMKLDAINTEKDVIPRWANLLSYAVASFCTAPMFFKGGWVDAGVAFLLGGAVGLMSWLSEKVPSYAHICEITMSVVVAFISEALHVYVCRSSVKFAGIVMLLPGYTITCSILELSSRHMISGSVRLFYAIIFSLLLSYGLTIGSSLWLLIDHNGDPDATSDPNTTGDCPTTLDAKWNILFVPLFAISLNVWLKAHPRQWILATILSIVGYTVNFTTSTYAEAKPEVSSALASFAIGFFGNLYQRATHQLTFQAVVCAVFFLVPGSIGLKTGVALFTDDMAGGVNLALQMVISAIAISVGLFASALVVYPMGKARSAQMTF